MSNAKHDANGYPTLIAVSSADGVSIVQVWADPVTHRLLVQIVGAVSNGFQIPTGTVDGVNRTFTFALAPSAIVVDGATLQKTEQGGTSNWTGTTVVVMTVAPTQSIFSVA